MHGCDIGCLWHKFSRAQSDDIYDDYDTAGSLCGYRNRYDRRRSF
jgi:hypothetical protein